MQHHSPAKALCPRQEQGSKTLCPHSGESQSHPNTQKQEWRNLLGCGIRDSGISGSFANTLVRLSSLGTRAKPTVQHSSGEKAQHFIVSVLCCLLQTWATWIFLQLWKPAITPCLEVRLQWVLQSCWKHHSPTGVPGTGPFRNVPRSSVPLQPWQKGDPFQRGLVSTHPGLLTPSLITICKALIAAASECPHP